MKCILGKEKFSNKAFQEWLMQKGITYQEFEQCHAAYRAVKNNKNTESIKIKISVAEKLLNILIKETSLIEAKLYGK